MKDNTITKKEEFKVRLLKFLKEYYRICKKYNIIVNGCGCCSSPFITDVKYKFDVEDEIRWQIEHLVSTLREIILGKEYGLSEDEMNEILKKLKIKK